jgi:hypothetical protein
MRVEVLYGDAAGEPSGVMSNNGCYFDALFQFILFRQLCLPAGQCILKWSKKEKESYMNSCKDNRGIIASFSFCGRVCKNKILVAH